MMMEEWNDGIKETWMELKKPDLINPSLYHSPSPLT